MTKALRIVLVMVVVLALAVGPVFAAVGSKDKAGPSEGRKIWDSVWRIINFGILAFLIVRYARRPLMDFLKKHGRDIGDRLDRSKTLLAEAELAYQEAEARMADMQRMISEVQEYIQQEAQRTRQRILEEAEIGSAHLLADAREKAQNEVRKSWDKVKVELVESAMEEAERIIRQSIGKEDEDRLMQEYMSGITALQSR